MAQHGRHRSGVGLFVVLFFVGAFVATVTVVAVRAISHAVGDNTTSIVDANVGDCFVLPIDGTEQTIELISVIDCADPHDAEVVHTGELNPDGSHEYPDDGELFALTEAACGDSGRFAELGFGILPIAPNEETWTGKNGAFVCVALSFGGRLVTGSILADQTV